jgi:uncharacterized protein (DUF2236 family)
VTVSERINAERIGLARWSRAILLQLAHPLVAAGVAEHSRFKEGPLRAAMRLHHTVRAMTRLTFGTPPSTTRPQSTERRHMRQIGVARHAAAAKRTRCAAAGEAC